MNLIKQYWLTKILTVDYHVGYNFMYGRNDLLFKDRKAIKKSHEEIATYISKHIV